jgi:hypothetical protein
MRGDMGTLRDITWLSRRKVLLENVLFSKQQLIFVFQSLNFIQQSLDLIIELILFFDKLGLGLGELFLK